MKLSSIYLVILTTLVFLGCKDESPPKKELLAPVLDSPEDDANIESLSATLKWHSVSGADSYALQVSTDSIFATLLFPESLQIETTKEIVGLIWETTYYWRVSAVSSDTRSQWSSTRHFRTTLQIPEMGLVAYFPFNADAIDASGNGHNGTIISGVTFVEDRHGIELSATLFDGSTGYIEIPSLNNLPYKPITYSVWVVIGSYFPSSPGHKFGSIIGRQEPSNPNCGMLGFFADSNVLSGTLDNTFLYWIGGASTPDIPNSVGNPDLSAWLHLVFTQDIDGKFSIFINGDLNKTGTISNIQNAQISFRIGSGIGGNSFFWNDRIDDVRIYNRALSAMEVLALYME